jgi:hypothetical protein
MAECLRQPPPNATEFFGNDNLPGSGKQKRGRNFFQPRNDFRFS